MKFNISRTTGSYSDEPICKGAVLLNPDKGEWDDRFFGIEINSLEELIELKNSVGHPIIVDESWDNEEYSPYMLEIYDDYRE